MSPARQLFHLRDPPSEACRQDLDLQEGARSVLLACVVPAVQPMMLHVLALLVREMLYMSPERLNSDIEAVVGSLGASVSLAAAQHAVVVVGSLRASVSQAQQPRTVLH